MTEERSSAFMLAMLEYVLADPSVRARLLANLGDTSPAIADDMDEVRRLRDELRRRLDR